MLPRGYSLGFIDTETGASIYAPSRARPLVPNVTEIAVSLDRVFGVDGEGAFVLDTGTGRIQYGKAPALFGTNGLNGDALVPVSQYPGRAPSALDNGVLLFLLFGPPIVVTSLFWKENLSMRA